jgi:hypothetical protein
VPAHALVKVAAVSKFEVEGEVLAEEDAEPRAEQPVRVLERYEETASLVLGNEARTAAIAAAGGVLAGAATVVAIRAVGAVTSRKGSPRRLARRPDRPVNVVASRSFLVDVHLLGR